MGKKHTPSIPRVKRPKPNLTKALHRNLYKDISFILFESVEAIKVSKGSSSVLLNLSDIHSLFRCSELEQLKKIVPKTKVTDPFNVFLKAARMAVNLSQSEVAVALGYKHKHSVANWEGGAKVLPPEFLLPEIATLYKLDLEELKREFKAAVIRKNRGPSRQRYQPL